MRLTKTAERNLLMAQHMIRQFPFGSQLTGRELLQVDAASASAKFVKPEEVVRVYDLVLQVSVAMHLFL